MSTEKKAEHTPERLHDLAPAIIGNKLLEEAREGAIRWINLYCAAAEIEEHECPYEDFKACPVCDEIADLNAQARTISDGWQQDWAVGILCAFELLAVLKEIVTLPSDSLRIKLIAQIAIQKAEVAQ